MEFALFIIITFVSGETYTYAIDHGLTQLDCFSQGVIQESFHPEINWYCEPLEE